MRLKGSQGDSRGLPGAGSPLGTALPTSCCVLFFPLCELLGASMAGDGPVGEFKCFNGADGRRLPPLLSSLLHPAPS